MFNNITWSYNKTSNAYTFEGAWGRRFDKAIHKIGYSINKQSYLFNHFTSRQITINRFFLPDLYYICDVILEQGFAYDVNLKLMIKLQAVIKNEILSVGKANIPMDMDAISKEFKYKPLPVQLLAYDGYKAVRAMHGSRGMLLDGAVGVGKTYISLSLAVALHSEVTLIIAPLPTIDKVWLSSINGEGCLYKQSQRVYLVGSSEPYAGERYVLAHYENIKKIVGLYKEYNINFTTLIVDEVHNFNEIKSTRTQLLMDMVDVIPFIHTIPMSGTPVKAKPSDLVPLLKIINTDFTKHIVKRFLKLYQGRSKLMLAVMHDRYAESTVVLRKSDMKIPPITTITAKVKISNGNHYTLENISKRLQKFMLTREKELTNQKASYSKVYLELYTRVKLSLLEKSVLKPTAFKAYEKQIDIIIANYKKNNLVNIPDPIKEANLFEKTYIEANLTGRDKVVFREAKTVHKYLKLKVQGEALANVIMRARIDCYTDLANGGNNLLEYVSSTVKKTLMFSTYISVCDAIKNKCKQEGLRPITVYGDTSSMLTQNVNIFTNEENVNPLIATYASLSTGVPLIVANVIVVFGLPFRQHVFDQMVGRVWRTGQDKPVSVYIVELDTGNEPNITDRDFDIIDYYRKEVAKITGNKDATVIDRMPNIANELHVNGFLDTREDYLDKLLSKTRDAITRW